MGSSSSKPIPTISSEQQDSSSKPIPTISSEQQDLLTKLLPLQQQLINIPNFEIQLLGRIDDLKKQQQDLQTNILKLQQPPTFS